MFNRNLITPLVLTGALALPLWSTANANADTIAYWRFEPGALTVDSSSNGHTLSNYGGVTSSTDTPDSGFSSGSAKFDGSTNDGFRTGDSLDLSGDTAITLEWFMKPDSGETGIIFEHSSAFYNTPTNKGAIIATIPGSDSTAVKGQQSTSGANYVDQKNGVVSATEWTHYAMIVDTSKTNSSDRVRLFVGDQEVTPSSETLSTNDPDFIDRTFFIGARSGEVIVFNGLIDEFRISDEALTPDQFLTVPEPGSAALVVGGIGLLLMGRRRGARAVS